VLGALALLSAPTTAAAQDDASSIVAVSTLVDSGAGAASGFGAAADWAEIRPGMAVSGGFSLFRSPWAGYGIVRAQLDRRVSPRIWLHLGSAGGRSDVAGTGSGVRRLTMGGQASFGRDRVEAKLHDVGVGGLRTTTIEMAAARSWAAGFEIRGLWGFGVGGDGAYGGGQAKANWRRAELSGGLIAGSLRAADIEQAAAELAAIDPPGALEWYLGAFLPTGRDSGRALGAFLKRRSGAGESRSILTLAARVTVR